MSNKALMKPVANPREEAKRAAKVLEAMKPALRVKIQKIATTIDSAVRDGLQLAWRLGDMYNDICDNEPKYGGVVVDGQSLTVQESTLITLGHISTSYLTQAGRFQKMFSEAQLDKLTELRMKYSGRPVNWMHMQRVLVLKEPKVQMKLLEQLCEHEWDITRLNEEIDKTLNRVPSGRNQGGRPIKIPHSLDGKLNNFAHVGHVVIRNAEHIYLDEGHGFLASVRDMPADRLTPDLIAKIDADIQVATRIEEEMGKIRRRLEDSRRLAEDRAAAHAREKAAQDVKAVEAEYEEKRPLPQLEDKSQDGKPAKKRGAQTPVGVG